MLFAPAAATNAVASAKSSARLIPGAGASGRTSEHTAASDTVALFGDDGKIAGATSLAANVSLTQSKYGFLFISYGSAAPYWLGTPAKK